jgi:hypothetical protein
VRCVSHGEVAVGATAGGGVNCPVCNKSMTASDELMANVMWGHTFAVVHADGTLATVCHDCMPRVVFESSTSVTQTVDIQRKSG